MEKIIRVFYDDGYSYDVELEPEYTECCLYGVSEEEYAEIVRLVKEANKLQALLETISKRQELKWDFDTEDFVPANLIT